MVTSDLRFNKTSLETQSLLNLIFKLRTWKFRMSFDTLMSMVSWFKSFWLGIEDASHTATTYELIYAVFHTVTKQLKARSHCSDNDNDNGGDNENENDISLRQVTLDTIKHFNYNDKSFRVMCSHDNEQNGRRWRRCSVASAIEKAQQRKKKTCLGTQDFPE